MKNVKGRIKLMIGAACLALITTLSLIASESVANKKATGWQKYDWRTESCVWGTTRCIIP